MANLVRLLNNVRNDNEVDSVFRSIDKKYPTCLLGATTPVSNQLFSPLQNKDSKVSSIIFTEQAYSVLQLIQDLDHKCSVLRTNSKLSTRPIRFICYGYLDFDGDIIINHIEVPIFNLIKNLNIPTNKQIEYLAFGKIPGDLNTHTHSKHYDYLRSKSLGKKNPIGSAIVSLVGYTKHPSKKQEPISNCFQLSEIANAVMPDIPTTDNILSGVLAITPKTIDATNIDSKHPVFNIQDGSLECAILTYTRSETTGTSKPTSIYNITHAQAITSDGKFKDLLISASRQDTDGLYRAKLSPTHSI